MQILQWHKKFKILECIEMWEWNNKLTYKEYNENHTDFVHQISNQIVHELESFWKNIYQNERWEHR